MSELNKNEIIAEIQKITDIIRETYEFNNESIPNYIPKKIVNSYGDISEKAYAFNRRLIREGKTFNYIDINKFYNPKTDRFFTPKLDKRYKTKVYKKKFRDLEKMQQVIINNSLEKDNQPNTEQKLFNDLQTLTTETIAFNNQWNDIELTEEQKNQFNLEKNFLENKEIIVDLKKISWAKVLELIQQNTTENAMYKARPSNSNTWITFSQNNIEKLKDIDKILGSNFTERVGSDNEFVLNITKEPVFIIKINIRTKKEGDNGAFFKYYHNFENITETAKKQIYSLGIYSSKPKSYINNCLYIALKVMGLPTEKLNAMKEFVKCGNVPICKLKKLATDLEIHLILKRKNEKDLFHYGNKEHKEYKINLLDNHYFADIKVNFSKFALENYEEIKDIKDFNKIYRKKTKNNKSYFDKKNGGTISSFQFVKFCLENKEKLLKSIPIADIMETPYYNNMINNNDLEYNPKNCCKENEPIKTDNSNAYRIFFDFETDTSRKDKFGNNTKHIPYLMCGITQDNLKICKYGEECGKYFLNTIRDKFNNEKPLSKYLTEHSKDIGCVKEVQLIAHNCRYDFTFLLDYLSATGLRPILNGTRLMGGSARIYINNHKDRHICNKKCDKDCSIKNKIKTDFGYKSPFIKINFQDSYNLISKPLRDFGDMFQLDCKKEILPYDLYTTKNISKKYVDITECLSFVKEEDKEEYLKNAKDWACISGDMIDIIGYSKKYCEMDCKVLQSGYNKFRQWIIQVCKLDIINYCSIASLSMDYLILEGCFDDCFKLSGRPREFIQKSVVGGRTMCRDNKKWKVEGKITDMDCTSLYSSAMERMDGFLKGMPKVIEKENLNVDWLLGHYPQPKNTKSSPNGFFVKVMAKNNAEKHGFPLLSNTEEDGIRNFSNETKGNIYHLDKTSLEDAMIFQKLDFDIICGYYYDNGHNNKINSVIRHLFNTRVEAKKAENPIQEIYKLLMNASYGKALLKPIETDITIVSNNKFNDYLSKKYNYIREITDLQKCKIVKETKVIDEHFNNCYAGVEVLSMSKRIMNEVMCLAENHKLPIYYQDTDSMHMNYNDMEKLEIEFRNKYGRELIGKDMGQFHPDFSLKDKNGDKCKDIIATKSIFLGKKSYVDILEGKDKNGKIITGIHTRMKGINTEGIIDYGEQKKCSTEDIYERLYEKNTLWNEINNGKFDLLASGKKVKFMYNKDMSVASCSSFYRSVNFKYEKGNINEIF